MSNATEVGPTLSLSHLFFYLYIYIFIILLFKKCKAANARSLNQPFVNTWAPWQVGSASWGEVNRFPFPTKERERERERERRASWKTKGEKKNLVYFPPHLDVALHLCQFVIATGKF